MSLDSGIVKPAQVKKASGVAPMKIRIPYDNWWITATVDGALAFVTASVNQKSEEVVTKSEVGRWPVPTIMEAATIVEGLTAPAAENT